MTLVFVQTVILLLLEEAILQMDLLGHDFFIYVDVEDQTTNVIYRREDGEIGLLEVKES